jgi:FixJ family two-component response regulator
MPQESITVYVVDDDESIRRALKRLLRSFGYHALTFESAEDFLDFTSGKDEGCIILDIHLPGMTGLDLQEKLASRCTEYSVIIMTAHDNPQWRERAEKVGVVAYLKKPFGEQSLLDAIRLACGTGSLNPDREMRSEAAGGQAGRTRNKDSEETEARKE